MQIKNIQNSGKGRSHNGRFCEMAALAPQKRQCELGSLYPAGSLVKPPPRKAAGTLGVSGRTVQRTKTRKIEKKCNFVTAKKVKLIWNI